MRSKTITLRIPQILLEAATELAAEEYESVNELMVGLLRYALAIHKPHTVTAAIARLTLAEQDSIDDELVKMFRSGESKKGQWFENRMRAAAETVASGKDIPKDRFLRELLRRINERSES